MGKYKDEPRYNVISLRISDNELKALQTVASAYAISKAKMMRQVIEMLTTGHAEDILEHACKR